MTSRHAFPWLMVAAVALAASTAGHHVMEWIDAIAGGRYGDYDHVAVGPVALVSPVLAAAGIVWSLAWGRGAGYASGAALAGRAILAAGAVRVWGFILALQLAALFAGESAEQLCAHEPLALSLAWLGGPPVIALAVHAVLAAIGTLLLRRCLRAVLETCALLFCVACALFVASPPERARPLCRLRALGDVRWNTALFLRCTFGLRAPPAA